MPLRHRALFVFARMLVAARARLPMPNIAALHPQVVHFVVALIVVGVFFRWLSLGFKASWLSPAALALIGLGTVASLVAVKSGTDAHGPVERVPGARPAVVDVWSK